MDKEVATLPADVQAHLGSLLRQAYRVGVDDGIPSDFAKLIASLEAVLIARDDGHAKAFREGLLATVPNLRAFAMSLTGNHSRADDLVQDTMLKAWKSQHLFQPGTNLRAWLFTILRNLSHSEHRRKAREVEDADGMHSAKVIVPPEQARRLEVEDLQKAMAKLTAAQREALLLVAAEGLPYEEAAVVCNCAVGTVKSRVNRARNSLALLMGMTDRGDWSETEFAN